MCEKTGIRFYNILSVINIQTKMYAKWPRLDSSVGAHINFLPWNFFIQFLKRKIIQTPSTSQLLSSQIRWLIRSYNHSANLVCSVD